MQIIPSILIQSETEFRQQVESMRGVLNFLQLDIADGQFVPNTTWADPKVVAEYSDLNFELHLMVQNPETEIKRWQGITNIKRILIHFETLSRNFQFPISNFQFPEVGLALNPDTQVKSIEPHLSQLNSILFMAVHPGFQGQKLIPEVLEKIKQFKIKYPNILAEIDGAVNEETLSEIIKSGVDIICPGSAIFGNNRAPKENVERMEGIINKLT